MSKHDILWKFINQEMSLRTAAKKLKCTMTGVYIKSYKLLKKTYHDTN